MKINDLNKLLDEGKVEEAGNDLLEELGDAAAKPEATKDSPAEEVKPEAEEKKVEEHLEDEHAAEGEEVKDVEIKEEIEPVEQPKAEAGEDKPEEAKPEAEVKAVKDMQDCENAEAAEEVEPVEITEDMINEYLNSLSDEEIQALNEENLDEFHFKQAIKDWINRGKSSINSALDRMETKSKQRYRDRLTNAQQKANNKIDEKNITLHHKNLDKALATKQKGAYDFKDALDAQNERRKNISDRKKEIGEAQKKNETIAKAERSISANKAKKEIASATAKGLREPDKQLKESIVEDNLEIEPEVVKAEEKHDDGVAEPIAPVAVDTKVEATDIPAEQPEKELDDVLNDKLEKEEEPAEEKSTYDLVTESLDSILAMLKEEAEAAAKPVATEEKPAEEAKPEVEVKAVKDMQDCENAEAAEEVEPVEITESVKRKYKTQNAGLSHVEVEKEFYTDKIDPSNPERRVHTVRTSVDDVDGSRKVIEDSDKPNSGKSNRDYGKLKEEVKPAEVPEAKKAEDKPEDVCPIGDAKEVEKDLNAEHAAEGEEVKDVEIKESSDELSISDMVAIVTEAARRCKAKGKVAGSKELCEEAEAVVGEFERKEFNIDKVLNSKDVAEMGTEENEKEIEKADDLHEEAEAAAKPVATEEKPTEEAKPEAEVKAVKDMQDCENAEAAEEIKAVEIKESVKYGSIKEACMLDEDYFTTDSYSVDTADKKFSRLTEQVALLMARESNDPMYNELLKEAVYTKRLQEAICEKYHSEAEKKACKIAKKNCK